MILIMSLNGCRLPDLNRPNNARACFRLVPRRPHPHVPLFFRRKHNRHGFVVTGAIAPFGSLLAPIFSNPHRLRATTTCRAPTVLPIGSGATSTPLPSDLEDESGWDLFSGRLGGSTRLGRRPLLGEPGEARVQQGSDDGANDRRCQV
jgi:hypothetical protein